MWAWRVNGAWPVQSTPSAPIGTMPVVSRSIQFAMKWQPIPARACEPSGTRVEVLCGQPEQKYGVRTGSGPEAGGTTGASGSETSRPRPRKVRPKIPTRREGRNSSISGTSGRPSASCLPRMRGRRSAGRSYSPSRSWRSTSGAFSSITSTVSTPAATLEIPATSSGWTRPTFSTATPARASESGWWPRSRQASIASPWALPTVTTRRRGRSGATISRSRGLARAKARIASSLASARASMARLGRSGQRMCRPPGGGV